MYQGQSKVLELVDVPFNPNSRPRNKLKQLGDYKSIAGHYRRPMAQRLLEFEQIALFDTTVSYVLFILIDTLISLLGPIEHPDKEIRDFLRENIDVLGGLPGAKNEDEEKSNSDFKSSQIYQALYRAIHCSLWAGFSTSEVLYTVNKGRLFIEDFLTYHPATIIVRPNKKGRLTEGEPTHEHRPSGIYQQTGLLNYASPGETQLPLWKTVHLPRLSFYGNYYGTSAIEPIYKWHLLKEAFIDMQAIALDRSGTPIVAITIPVYNTNQTEVDPVTGEERQLTTQEILERQTQTQNFGGGGNLLLLPQFDEKLPPKAQVLTSGSNVGESFEIGIDRCDRELAKGLWVPFVLFPFGNRVEGMSDTYRAMELFNRIIVNLHRQFIHPLVSQSFHQCVKQNFSRESANIAPWFPIRQTTRPEDRVALMQMISGLTDRGYFNPLNDQDWLMVREMVDAISRAPNDVDRKFINDMIIVPKQPAPGGSSKGSVRGKGVGAGRPTGTSAPKSNKS
ncbi:hypothetical protein OsccyDRAFT_0676 [Leptolyngbyaceae cyanobacterium JSC-12]|nr:hypothetical protein OsccyDRAFT_0676 [Leptolyngbyaceae cyanobacterium JSC-12]